MPKLARYSECTGCLACHDVCRHHAIKVIEKNNLPFVTIDDNKCIECGLCQKTCPIVSPIKTNKLEDMSVYGGWAKDEESRINAASGGAFTGLAQSFFKVHQHDKVAVVGATLEHNRVKHILIEDEKDIPLLANSKYIQSDTKGIYQLVAEKLRAGYWIMFSGCPCQVAGLYGALGKKRYHEHLITIEVVCHGIASNEALDIHLAQYNSDKLYRFRDKRLGTQDWKYSQTTTIKKDGVECKLRRNNDVFYAIYASWLLDRKCCSDCKFARLDRMADITLADFWGLSVPDYYKQGVSLVIANNNRAQAFIENASEIYVFEGSLKVAIEGNPNLYMGYKFIKYHPIVMWPGGSHKILPVKLRESILTNKMPHKLFWAFFKVATKLLINYKKKKAIAEITHRAPYLLKNVNVGGVKWPQPINNSKQDENRNNNDRKSQ